MPKGVLNPRDGKRYVWDWNNDIYVRCVQDAQGNPDYEFCEVRVERGVTPNELNKRYNLALNDKDQRDAATELNNVGTADVFLDANGQPLGYLHDNGTVGGLPEWSKIDWIEREYMYDPRA